MIGIQLVGGLGNQMFQYAAARVAAERLGCAYAILAPAARPLGRRHFIPYIVSSFGLPVRGSSSVYAEMGRSFPAVTQRYAGVLLQVGGEKARRLAFERHFEPRHVVSDSGGEIEVFDADFFKLQTRTMLKGFFQSESYFSSHEAQVRRWFRPSQVDRMAAEAIVTQEWRRPCDQMLAIHVRRTDYLTQKEPFSHPQLGWALPNEYYSDAISALPSGLKLAVFSDDPGYASEMFRPFDAWVSRGNSASCDLLLMSLCRYMVIANSSLSWWGAWLNTRTDKVIMAPKYHIGWWRGCWFPGDIAVKGWNYLDVIHG